MGYVMTPREYEKLTNENKYYVRRAFFENKNNACCSLCDSMIGGYCYTCKAWCTNIKPDEKECFRIRNVWKEFLQTINRKELNMLEFNKYNCDDEDYEEYEIIPFDEYFTNDYLVESLLNGKLEDVLDRYEEYYNNIIEKHEGLADDNKEE